MSISFNSSAYDIIIQVKYDLAKHEFKYEFLPYQLVKNFNRMLSSIFSKSIHKNGYSPLWIHVKKLTEEETFYFKTNISYNNIWQLGGEQNRLFETY